jgi:hypothetical protein
MQISSSGSDQGPPKMRLVAGALSQVGPAAAAFPSVPPVSGNPYADALGVFEYPFDRYFTLLISDQIVEEVVTALTGRELGWDFDETDRAIGVIDRIAEQCGGGLVTAEMGVSLPTRFGVPASSALRTAASKEISSVARPVVTEDSIALAIGEFEPRGIPWPTGGKLTILDPGRFAKMAEKVRWKMRHVPGDSP